MVNLVRAYKPILRRMMKLVGLRPQEIEIEPGTVMNIWAPTKASDKHAVVLLHGFAADGMLTWQFQALSLARTYSVYVPDFMFFGSSTTDKPERSVAFQARCVGQALKKIGVDRCILVGFSYGGFVSFELAQAFPELVEALVITCSVTTLTESISADCFRRFADDGVVVTRWSDYLLPDSTKGVREQFKFAMYRLPRWIPDCIFRQYLEAMFDFRKEKAELLEALVIPDDKDPNKIPTLSQRMHLLWAEDDKIFPMEIANALKKKLGDKATMEHIERAGHLVMLERPSTYTRRLRKTLASFVEDSHRSSAI